MLLHVRYNVNGDAPVDIDSLYERRLVNFARAPGHSTGAPSVNDQMGLKCISVLET